MSLAKEIRNALILPQQAHSDIRIAISVDPSCEQVQVDLDAVQIRQVMNNLIQNSVDSIRTKLESDRDALAEIRIVIARNTPDEIFVAVTDSGMGLPSGKNPERLTEPYVTHKTKGTGLGLAIVKKIMEDHRGKLLITVPAGFKNIKGWSELGGATLILTFPLKSETTHQTIKKEVA